MWICSKDTSSWSCSIGLTGNSVVWIVVIDGIRVSSKDKSSSEESSQILTDPVEWKLIPFRSTSKTKSDGDCRVQMSAWIRWWVVGLNSRWSTITQSLCGWNLTREVGSGEDTNSSTESESNTDIKVAVCSKDQLSDRS